LKGHSKSFAILIIFVLLAQGCCFLCRPKVEKWDGKKKYEGYASWYGSEFHGHRTSNGEIYNMYSLTAAHRSIPFNSIVEVKNLDNGKKVIVRINDRGPFVRGRIIDLSYAAGKKIGLIGSGTARVKLKVLQVGYED
jgi:rare lipoprotein A